jgi:hypothetical protein
MEGFLGARRRARVVLDELFGDEDGECCFGIFVDVEGLYQSVVEGELSALGGECGMTIVGWRLRL